MSDAIHLALEHHRAGRLAEAEAIYRQLLGHSPHHPVALHMLGLIAHQVGNGDAAIELITGAVTARPDYAEAHANLGAVCLGCNRLEQSIASSSKALALDSKYTDARINLALAYLGQGELEQAIPHFERAADERPGSAEAQNGLGFAFLTQGKVEQAIACFRRALLSRPDYPEANRNLGDALLQQGQPEAAASCYRAAIAAGPPHAGAHRGLGESLFRLNQLEAAVASYRSALSLDPASAETHNNLGAALTGLGRVDESIACYRQAAALNPAYAEAHYNLGIALGAKGMGDEAIASYRRTIALDPMHADAHNNLASELLAHGRLDEAMLCYRQAMALGIEPKQGYALAGIASHLGDSPRGEPNRYVSALFDAFAERFDAQMVKQLSYRGPEEIVALIERTRAAVAEKWDVLDLGCGTGLAGLAIAPRACSLVGVDLSTRMLDKARARGIYTRLENADVLAMMRGEASQTYDVIASADVFIYIATLDTLFAEARRLLRPGGFFGFTVEALEPLPGIRAEDGTLRESWLTPTWRYAQSAAYIERLARECGFATLDFESAQLRMEKERPVQGWVVLLQKPAA